MIDLKKIFLDFNNPRFILLKKSEQADYREPFYFFLSRQKHRKQIEELLEDILKVGLTYRYFLLLKENADKYIVLDGNRRIFVLKFLFLEEFRVKIKNFNPTFYQKCMLHFTRYESKISSILKQYESSFFDQKTNLEEAQVVLERHHNNTTEDGKVMRGWPTWETRIHQKEPTALFIFSHFSEWGYTNFLETINKKPNFRYTTARDLLKFKPALEWLCVEKLADGTFSSINSDETHKRLLTIVYYVLKNSQIKATQFFYDKKSATNTLQQISEKMRTTLEYDFGQILDQLEIIKTEQEKKQINNEKIIDNKNASSIKKPDIKWFSSVEFFEATEKQSKIYDLMNSINKMTELNLRKFHLLVFMTLRPLIEMIVNEYFVSTNQKNLDPGQYNNDSSTKYESLTHKIKKIYFQIKKNNKNEVFDLEAIYTLWYHHYISKLNSILHQNSDFATSFESLKNYIKLIDGSIKTIKKAIRAYKLYNY